MEVPLNRLWARYEANQSPERLHWFLLQDGTG